MADVPRASKRRKLDSPSRDAPEPLPKPSTRKSGRLPARSSSRLTAASTAPAEERRPARSASRSTRNGKDTANKQKLAKIADVWDDIEGALGEDAPKSSKSKPVKAASKRSTRKKALDDAADTTTSTDELQQAPEVTPRKKQTKSTPNKESANRSSLKSLADGFRPSDDVIPEAQDELAEPATPSRRASKRAAPSTVRKTINTQSSKDIETTSKPTSLRKARVSARTSESDASEDIGTRTPSQRRRARPARFRDDETIPETEDELANKNTRGTKAVGTKRRTNRVDRTLNAIEEVTLSDDEEQAQAGAEEADDDDAMSIDGNSVLENVLDITEPSPFNKPSSTQKERPDVPLLVGFIEPGDELNLLKTVVLERISGRRPVPLIGLDAELRAVQQLVEQTVTAGEGNSMLLIGARGSGKTALVNKVLSEVSKDNAQDYHVVRLNGFIHTDDKIALREIWRQLGKEMDLDEEGGGVGKNYADTLTTLLALLSHPSEQTGELTDQVAKAVIFIIDEFDLFAHHPRQTLLYNLFDIAQSRKAPIAVLGLTTRIDVANTLEKRVKSRFSHRYLHFTLAKTFTAFQELCKANLLIQTELLSIEERGLLESDQKKTIKKVNATTASDALSQWNSNINTLFTSKTFLTTHLAPLFYRSKSIPTTLTTFLLPTASLSSSLSLSHPPVLPPDSKLALIPHLSTLALSLLIAAARLDIIHDSDTCNFNMAYDEYVTLASKARIQSAAGGASASSSMSKVWGKEVASREWEGLVGLGFMMPVVAGVTGGFGMVKVDVSLEEIGGTLAGEKTIEKGLERWCKQI